MGLLKKKNGETIKPKEVNVKNVEKNKNKPQKLKKTTGIKVLRSIVWIIIGLVCLKGILSIVKPDPVRVIQKNDEKFKAELSKENQIESRAFSFAESFAREYFTLYSGEKEDYQKRLAKYIERSKVEGVDVKGNTSVDSVQAYNIKKYRDNQLDVYVYAKIQVKVEKPGQEAISNPNMKQYDITLKDVYIDVPIYYTASGEMVVENLPIMVGTPKIATQKENTESMGLGLASNVTVNEIQDSLNQFFKAYYQGDQTQVDYFLDKPGNITAVAGDIKFTEIEKNNVYDLGNNEFKAIVEFKVDMVGKSVNQKMNVNLGYKDGKYLIKNIDARVTNYK